ncbi:hypothetical protein GC093_02860 [Paenibacillus sp. LMG 31456]|uniref:Uncharacterized protein n=1 Tax=Paenibacillus foliorum TaxID=2654974 RepID=A0A972GQY1_9BACL|nr:hypothetical protein [Paenibacillus foliorum]NOU92177.1 hypothetical protein [Paenibacillus foliorum]
MRDSIRPLKIVFPPLQANNSKEHELQQRPESHTHHSPQQVFTAASAIESIGAKSVAPYLIVRGNGGIS